MKNSKVHIDNRAAAWTVVCLIGLAILLFIFGFTTTPKVEESGMLINFGDTETGHGRIEPPKATPPVKKKAPLPSPPKPEVIETAKESLNTQDFEEAAALESAKKKEEEQKIQEAKELEERRQEKIRIEQQEEKERQEAIEAAERKQQEIERQEKERLEQERLEREAKAEAIRKQTSNAFGKTNSTSPSQGNGQGAGNQGSPNGSTTSNGNGLGTSGNWSLAGRSLQGSLPRPSYKIQEEGIVVVEIAVDRSGKVVSATPILRGSTTQDAQLWQLAKAAALKAKFDANPSSQAKQVGTITYSFKLN